MALTWAAKAPDAVWRFTWEPPLADGDSLSAYTVSASGATVDSDSLEDGAVVVFVSGGTAATTATFTFTATSSQGEEFSETIYLPIVSPDAKGQTVRDVCSFALRKIVGREETPDDNAVADATERLEDMLRMWKETGADVGAAFPLTANTVLNIRDSFLGPIKANLLLEVADLYGEAPSAKQVAAAMRGLQHVKMANLSDSRAAAEYY